MRSIPKDADRCTFVSTDGRRCCMTRVAPNSAFCFNHWKRQHEQEQFARAGDEIVAAGDSLHSQDAIHKALGNVFRLLAHNRITSRNAAVLGYLGQLMLVNCPTLERMLQSYLPMMQFAIKTRQQMDRSDAHADRHQRHLFELHFDLLERLLAHPDTFKNMSAEERREMSEAIDAAFKKAKQARAKD